MSSTSTAGIRVRVTPEYWAERSMPESGQFAFRYTVEISNQGTAPAQLKRRHWVITDAHGRMEEVTGEGVVGKTPNLGPGEQFEYTSYVMLKTPFGSMRGSYFLVRPDGTEFEAKIGEFALTQPHALH
jgi:ApaG protein